MRKPKLPSELVLGHPLTEAHRAFILTLPADGAWKSSHADIRAIERRHGPNSLRGFGQSPLLEGYYREEVRHRLTEEGQEVRAFLEKQSERLGA